MDFQISFDENGTGNGSGLVAWDSISITSLLPEGLLASNLNTEWMFDNQTANFEFPKEVLNSDTL